MAQGNITAGYCVCPVCGARHSQELLVHSHLRAHLAGPEAFDGWAMCPIHELAYYDGLIAVVEVAETPEGADAREQLEVVQRTGQIMMVHQDRWSELFDFPAPLGFPMIFIEPEALRDAQETARLGLH